MVTQSWLYDAIIYIYALSLLFYFSDFVGTNRRAKRVGTGLLAFVWVLQTAYLAVSVFANRATFAFTMFETLFLFAWILVTLSLVISRFMSIDMLVFLVNVFGFAVLALHFFSNPEVDPFISGWEVSDELMFIHVTLAVGSYAAFTIGAALSCMYLFLHRQLKEKHWTSNMKRMPSLEKLELYTYRAVLIGAPMLLLALSLGFVWIALAHASQMLTDPKVVNSVFVLAAYSFYLVQRISFKAPGPSLALWNLAAFAFVVANFIVSNWFSNFHQWIWS